MILTIAEKIVIGIIFSLLMVCGFKEYQVLNLRAEIATIEQQYADSTARADLAAKNATSKQAIEDQAAIVNRLMMANADMAKQLEDVHALQNSPKTDDGPVAPVLRRAVGQLH